MPKCYSYIRFSSEKQSQGDSIRRQLELSARCQSAFNIDPLSASKTDPPKPKKMQSHFTSYFGCCNQGSSSFFLPREWAKV